MLVVGRIKGAHHSSVRLSQALSDALASRGFDPETLALWRLDIAEPLSGDVDALTAQVIATGPLEVAGLLLPLIEEGIGGLLNASDAPETRTIALKPAEVVALAKAYLDFRSEGMSDLGLSPPPRP
jgi:hypothetical protein